MTISSRLLNQALALCLLPLSLHVWAADDPLFDFSNVDARYFGTLARSYGSSGTLEPRANLGQNFGETPSGTFSPDSKAGLQIDWRLTSALSLTAMGYCQREGQDGCPQLLWAYAKWDFAEGYSAKAGKFRLAPFLGSEALEVGYLSPWARAPQELYNIYPSDDVTGLYAERAWSVPGSGEIVASPFGGAQHGYAADAGDYKVSMGGAKLRGTWPSFEWVLAATRYSFDYTMQGPITGLLGAARAYGYDALANDYSPPIHGWLYSAGLRWAPSDSPYFAQAELGDRTSDKVLANDLVSGYAMAGVRHGAWTYFGSRGFAHNLSSPTETGGGPLNPAFQSTRDASIWSHRSWIAGTRYEIDKHWDAKLQLGWHRSSGGADASVNAPGGPLSAGGFIREAIFAVDYLY